MPSMSGSSGASQSNVGFRSLYEAGDQRTHADQEIDELARQSGKNIRGFLPKDQSRKVDNMQLEETHRDIEERMKRDPTYAAEISGNGPSRGALVDKDLQEEDERILRRKGDAMTGKSM